MDRPAYGLAATQTKGSNAMTEQEFKGRKQGIKYELEQRLSSGQCDARTAMSLADGAIEMLVIEYRRGNKLPLAGFAPIGDSGNNITHAELIERGYLHPHDGSPM